MALSVDMVFTLGLFVVVLLETAALIMLFSATRGIAFKIAFAKMKNQQVGGWLGSNRILKLGLLKHDKNGMHTMKGVDGILNPEPSFTILLENGSPLTIFRGGRMQGIDLYGTGDDTRSAKRQGAAMRYAAMAEAAKSKTGDMDKAMRLALILGTPLAVAGALYLVFMAVNTYGVPVDNPVQVATTVARVVTTTLGAAPPIGGIT